jgi:hypothetical protein
MPKPALALALRTALLLALATAPLPTLAGPAEYVISLPTQGGRSEVDFGFGSHGGDGASGAFLGVGHSVTDRWFTEVLAKWLREPGGGTTLEAWEWENRLRLTPASIDTDPDGDGDVHAANGFSAGLLLEIERPRERAEGYELTYGPLMHYRRGAVEGTLNLLLQQHIDARTAHDTELHYQAQLKYSASEALGWGVQAFGSVGRWNRWSTGRDQEHKVGPAAFGEVHLSQGRALEWNAAVLFGATPATPQTTLRLQLEYEF